MGHRAERTDGCPVATLGSDAARQSADVRASFEAGIREYLEMLGKWIVEADGERRKDQATAVLATMIGAVTLSRAVNDPHLAQAFLHAAAQQVREVVAA